MKICVFSVGEVACWENYGDLPDCSEGRHHHISIDAALEGVRNDHYRFVCGCRIQDGPCICKGRTNFAVTEHSSNRYNWKKVPSAGYPVQQFVPRRMKKPHAQKIIEAPSTAALSAC